MAELGWPIEAEYKADLNGDGQDEWLVWTTAPIGALLFVATGDDYQVSHVRYLAPPNENAEFVTSPLPGQAGVALVRYAFGECPSYDMPWYGDCHVTVDGHLILWRLADMELREVGRTTFCEQLELSELLPEEGELHGCQNEQEIVYTWDAATMTYIAPNETLPQNEYECSAAYQFCGFTYPSVEALPMLDNALENPPENADDSFLLAVRYRRALILETGNRATDALADYTAVYEAAPESAWGKLALLHLMPSSAESQ
jgi:hypothetical protein